MLPTMLPHPPDAVELRADGIERASRSIGARHPATLTAAHRWIVRRAVRPGSFTSEDLISHLESRQLITPDQRLVWIGGVFAAAHRWQIIARNPATPYVQSVRPGRHQGPVGSWVAGRRAHLITVHDWNVPLDELGASLLRRKAAADLSRRVYETVRPAPDGPTARFDNGPAYGVASGPSLDSINDQEGVRSA